MQSTTQKSLQVLPTFEMLRASTCSLNKRHLPSSSIFPWTPGQWSQYSHFIFDGPVTVYCWQSHTCSLHRPRKTPNMSLFVKAMDAERGTPNHRKLIHEVRNVQPPRRHNSTLPIKHENKASRRDETDKMASPVEPSRGNKGASLALLLRENLAPPCIGYCVKVTL